MQTLRVKVDRGREAGHLGRQAKLSDVKTLISPDTVLESEAGEPLVVFGRFNRQHPEVKAFLPTLEYQNNQRMARVKISNQQARYREKVDFENLRSEDLNFGFKPLRPVFQLPASSCLFNQKYAAHYQTLARLGAEMMGLYERFNPRTFAEQVAKTQVFRSEWKIPGTFFTQGIINDTVNLDYHYDRNNITGCWSAMAVFRRDIVGGQLVIPALDVALDVQDECYLFFDGQSLLHGVHEITKTGTFGRRFSIVFYAIEAMKNCGTYEQELERMRQVDMNKHRKHV